MSISIEGKGVQTFVSLLSVTPTKTLQAPAPGLRAALLLVPSALRWCISHLLGGKKAEHETTSL